MKRTWLKQDVAYGCFLVWALTVLAAAGVSASFTEDDLAQGAGASILVFLPFLCAAFIAMLVGVVLSIRLWRHWPLPVIAVCTALVIAMYVRESESGSSQSVVPIAYGVGVVAMSGYWFLYLRRRHLPLEMR
jgi:cell division protein FtsW (lipid II flippase)